MRALIAELAIPGIPGITSAQDVGTYVAREGCSPSGIAPQDCDPARISECRQMTKPQMGLWPRRCAYIVLALAWCLWECDREP